MVSPTLWEIESDFILLMARMSKVGIKIDRQFCETNYLHCLRQMGEIRSQLHFNPSSTKELGNVLLNEMKLPVVATTEKGAPSFDKKAMEEYEFILEARGSELAQLILAFRGWSKTSSSNYKAYLDLADKYDILHPGYKVHGTHTCRTSCENPNLQQIPRESAKPWNGTIKKAFIPRPGHKLFNFDFAQLELRLAAAVSKEPELLEAFDQDVDVFDVMADSLGWTRQNVKTFYYATGYGAGIKRIAYTFGIPVNKSAIMINNFYRKYPGLKRVTKKSEELAKKQGYLTYWTGRRRHFPNKNMAYKAFNSWNQGGAFEIVKRALLRADQRHPWDIVLTVHDSAVPEIPEAEATEENLQLFKKTLEDIPEDFGVPFKVTFEPWG